MLEPLEHDDGVDLAGEVALQVVEGVGLLEARLPHPARAGARLGDRLRGAVDADRDRAALGEDPGPVAGAAADVGDAQAVAEARRDLVAVQVLAGDQRRRPHLVEAEPLDVVVAHAVHCTLRSRSRARIWLRWRRFSGTPTARAIERRRIR